jgi:hypothetical protein
MSSFPLGNTLQTTPLYLAAITAPGGTISANTDTTLGTCTIAANTLRTNGDKVVIRAYGRCNVNGPANTSVWVIFGAFQFALVANTSGGSGGEGFFIEAEILRLANDGFVLAVKNETRLGIGLTPYVSNHSPGSGDVDWTAAQTFAVRGRTDNGSSPVGDVIMYGMTVEYWPIA